MSCTACASTWAAEWRMTLRPSAVSAATGAPSASLAGVQLRSRSRPSVSRTTTIAFGSPRPGRPASRIAAAAVVPAGTRIGSAGLTDAAVVIAKSPTGLMCLIAGTMLSVSRITAHADLRLAAGSGLAQGWVRAGPRLGQGRPKAGSGLARPQPHEQRLAVGQQHLAVGQPTLHEDLASVYSFDARVDLQSLFDRHDMAVVDVQESGSLVRAARELRSSVAKQRA